MTAYGSPYTKVDQCPDGPHQVMQIGDALIWAGKQADLSRDLAWDLRIRLNDGFASHANIPIISANDEAKRLLPDSVTGLKYPPTLDIDWPDFGVPGVGQEWWQNLVDAIANIGPANVAVYCYGGHGRTGTALSILASLSGNVKPGDDPVEWVRNKYCDEAVESWTQITYIQDVIGWEIESHPAFTVYNRVAWNRSNTTGALETTWEDPMVVTKVEPKVGTGSVPIINAQTSVFATGTGTKGQVGQAELVRVLANTRAKQL